jgi:hypothetical protein
VATCILVGGTDASEVHAAFDAEVIGSMFLSNVGINIQDYTALKTRIRTSTAIKL